MNHSHTLPATRLLQFPKATPVGHYPFDHVLRKATVKTHRDALDHTLNLFPELYQEAEESFDPAGWRFFLYAGRYPWAVLCDASFDPRRELIQLAVLKTDVPAELIGDDPSLAVEGVLQDLAEAWVDSTRATWLVLGFIQSLQLEQTEILQSRWWEQRYWKSALQGALTI